jgi:hypothetical protein
LKASLMSSGIEKFMVAMGGTPIVESFNNQDRREPKVRQGRALGRAWPSPDT